MLASIRIDVVANAIHRMHFLETLLPDLTPELGRVDTAFRKTLLEIRSERINVTWENALLAFRKDSGIATRPPSPDVVSAVIRITGGNFRLMTRLLTQMELVARSETRFFTSLRLSSKLHA